MPQNNYKPSASTNHTFDASLHPNSTKNPAHILHIPHNNSFLQSQRQNNAPSKQQYSTLQAERLTKEGFIIAFTHPSLAMFENERYINPKMEEELKVFKKKIAYRFENSQIPKDFVYPRPNVEVERNKYINGRIEESPSRFNKNSNKLTSLGMDGSNHAKRRYFSQTFYNQKHGG